MKYTINILKESKAAFIMELLSSFDFIQIEPEATNVHDWWDDLTAKDKSDLKQSLLQGEQGEEKSMEEVFKKHGL
jgi:hypothetical protein